MKQRNSEEKNSTEFKVSLLKEEYDLLAKGIEETIARLFQLLALGTTALGGAAGYIASSGTPSTIPLPLLWISPAIILLVFGIAVIFVNRWSTSVFHIRLLSERLSHLVNEPADILYYHPTSIASKFNSMRRGNIKYRFSFISLFILIIALFIYLMALSFATIYTNDHFQGLTFLLFYGFVATGYVLGLHGIVSDLPSIYDEALQEVKSKQSDLSDIKPVAKIRANAIQLLIPRPTDFIGKTWLFAVGAILATWYTGINYHPKIWELFITQSSNLTPPIWTVTAFAILWYFIEEGLVQQAKYMWNDLRDRKIDQHLEGKRERAVSSESIDPRSAIVFMLARWLIGLAVGAWLDSGLFLLLIVISLIHILYELWVKPNGAKHSVLVLVFVASGSSIRVLGGILSVGGDLSDLHLVALILIFLFFGIGSIATFWKIEADYLRNKQILVSPRKQSDYFFRQGRSLQRFGFIGMLICAMFNFVDTLSCSISNTCVVKQAVDTLTNLTGTTNATGIAFIEFALVLSVVLLITFSCWRFVAQILQFFIRTRLLNGLQFLLALWLIALANTYPSALDPKLVIAVLLIVLSLASFGAYESISYEQYLFINVRNNLRLIGTLWLRYFFVLDTGMSFPVLLSLTARLSSERKEEVIEKLKNTGVDVSKYVG